MSLSRESDNFEDHVFKKSLQGYVSKGFLKIGDNVGKLANKSTPLVPLSLIHTLSQGQSGSREGYIKATQLQNELSYTRALPTQSDPRQKELMMKMKSKYQAEYSDYGTQGYEEDLQMLMSPELMVLSNTNENVNKTHNQQRGNVNSNEKDSNNLYDKLKKANDIESTMKKTFVLNSRKDPNNMLIAKENKEFDQNFGSVTGPYEKQLDHVRKKLKADSSLGNFFKNNMLTMEIQSKIDDNQIRFSSKLGGATRTDKDNHEYFHQKFLAKKAKSNQDLSSDNSTKGTRAYRQGELPDILISYKDILNPLINLATFDVTIAQEIFVPIFVEIFKDAKDDDTKK